MLSRAVVVGALLMACPVLFAQSKEVPYTVSIDGSLMEVVYNASHLHDFAKLVKYKDGPKVTASQNTQSLRMAVNEIDGTPKTPTKWSIHRCLPNGVGTGGGQVSCVVVGVKALHMPTLDVTASEAAYFGIDLLSSDATFDGFFQTSQAEKDVIKSQKKWLPANFRIKIGDLPCDRVSRIERFTIQRDVADFDGDGQLDFGIAEDITITLPAEDASKFAEWIDSTRAGSDTPKRLELDYMDDDQNSFLFLSTSVNIVSMGFADPFIGAEPTAGREVRVKVRQYQDRIQLLNRN